MMDYEQAAKRGAAEVERLTGQFASTGYDQRDGWLVSARDPQGMSSISITEGQQTYVIPVRQVG